MSPLDTIRLVAGREISTRIRSKAFLWTTGLIVVAIVAGGVILDLALGSSSATSVAVTPQTAPLAQPLQDIARTNDEAVRILHVEDDAAARAAVADEEADLALTGNPTDFTVVVRPSQTRASTRR